MVEARSPRLQALLAYLILHRDTPHSRQRLAFLFWPDAIEAQARNAFRQLLFQLRKTWPQADQFIRMDAHTMQWRSGSPLDLDVAQFQVALAHAEQAATVGEAVAEEDALTRAVDVYRGDLLPNCYDDWIAPERDRLREQCMAAVERLSQLHEDKRDYAMALRHAQRLQRLDPLREPTYVRLMRLHALNEDQPSASRAYRTCFETLERELGVEPSKVVHEAYARLAALAAPAERQRPPDATLPMVARHEEWRQLLSSWHRASVGNVRFALISGEAGIGKSRLAEELLVHLAQQGFVTARTRAYAAEGTLSLAPVTDWLRAPALREALSTLDKLWLTEVARLLPELLTEYADLPPPSPLTEYWQRQRFFEALARSLLANREPLLLLLDDLQWCDTETLEWLRFLMRFDPHAKLLIVATARSEEVPPGHAANTLIGALRGDDQVVEISLSALDAAETAKVGAQVAGEPLDEARATRLFQETEGNPLFVVEMMRARANTVPDDRAREATALNLPPKVHAVISTRLRHLSPGAREAAALAAVVGRAFTSDVLACAGDLNEDALIQALDELWQRRIVREIGRGPGGVAFDFTHDKIRDVAYAEVTPLQRRRLHRRVAQALERTHARDVNAVSAQIAAHYERAGEADRAAAFYRRAAQVAQRLYAYDDAIALLERGLSQSDLIADPHERARQELELQLDLAPPIRIARGWASPELQSPLRRAVELSKQVGDTNQQARAQISLAFFHEVRAEFGQAQRLGEELLSRFSALNSGTYAVMLRTNLAGGRVQAPNWAAVEAEFRRGLDAYQESQHSEHVALMGGDFGVLITAWSAHALWFMGLAEQALQRGRAAVSMANRLAHPFSQALALAYLGTQYVFRRELDPALQYAYEAQTIAEQHNVAYYRAWSNVLLAWVEAKRLPGAKAVTRMRNAIEDFRATGGRIRLTLYLGLLAECLGDAGETGAAFTALDEALECSERFGEHWVDAELYRLRGEVLLRNRADVREAESSLMRALQVAHAQDARPLELRAAISLMNLRQARHDAEDGRAIVESALARLTEGLDVPDVLEARALLAR